MTTQEKVGWSLATASALAAVTAATAASWMHPWPDVIAAGAAATSTATGAMATTWGLLNKTKEK